MSLADLLLVLAAFLGMEGVSYVAHRFLMHGPGMGWHRSHHVPTDGGFEKNDLYPLTASSLAIAAFSLGTFGPEIRPLVLVGAGMTLYGLSYLFVHEVYIHRRMGPAAWRVGALERLREAHRIHHLFGGEPYGMLLPVVPRALRQRAAASPRDPLVARVRASA